jgi:hypothetical protein
VTNFSARARLGRWSGGDSRRHVKDEESEQFPQIRAQVPAEKLVALAGKVESAKKLAPTRPHPSTPNSEFCTRSWDSASA